MEYETCGGLTLRLSQVNLLQIFVLVHFKLLSIYTPTLHSMATYDFHERKLLWESVSNQHCLCHIHFSGCKFQEVFLP